MGQIMQMLQMQENLGTYLDGKMGQGENIRFFTI